VFLVEDGERGVQMKTLERGPITSILRDSDQPGQLAGRCRFKPGTRNRNELPVGRWISESLDGSGGVSRSAEKVAEMFVK